METLAILDYSTQDVHLFYISPDTEVDDEYIAHIGFNPDECFWMIGDNVGVTLHKGVLK